MNSELRKLLKPSEPAPTIGERNMTLRAMPVRSRHDFYDTAGRLHGLIVLLPVAYGVFQTQLHHPLTPLFWWLVLGTVCFALFARRHPFLRLTAVGISFPESKSPEYPWDEMIEARSRQDELELVMLNGLRLEIPFKNMRTSDINRLKKLIRGQFAALGERAREAAGQAIN